MRDTTALRDPWVAGGLALLFLLSVGTVAVYRTAPQSVAEARARSMVAVRPSAFAPRIARAEERARTAAAAAASGDSAAALEGYAAAAGEAWAARELAADSAESAAATELWAGAVLERAAMMLAAASSPWWRRDDDPALRDALAESERVLAVPTSGATRARAEALAAAIRTKLRPGPLEWLPRR